MNLKKIWNFKKCTYKFWKKLQTEKIVFVNSEHNFQNFE